MFLTEQEILDTPKALERTCSYLEAKGGELSRFFAHYGKKKFTILGCGSSYMLAKSAAALFHSLPGTTACALPAGDYIIDPLFWRGAIEDSIVVTISRSGRTSEMVRAVKQIKQTLECPVISISAEDQNDIMPMSDLDLTLDWCYDKSVCQTRTVSNFYAAALLLAASYSKNTNFEEQVKEACKKLATFQTENRPTLEKVAAMNWNNVVVLADGPVCGIAEEGALAFTEIAMLAGRYFHLLDYRHGPIVISGADTLTFMLLRPGEDELQGAMVRDVISHGGPVVTVSEQAGNPYGATAHIQIEGIYEFAAWGIPFIYLAQMTSLLKAMELGGNPDAPKGLDPYITLK